MNPIVKLAASALPGEKKYILFAGAGVSKDAGVPTAWDLMLKTAGLLYSAEDGTDREIDLEKWFIDSKYAEMEYSELIGEIYSTSAEQQAFLKDYLNNYEVGDAHRSIAELAWRGIIRCIITTNFDHYIEKALAEKGLEYQVISTEEDLKYSEPLIHCKPVRIYKPNGTLGHGALRNTPKDLEELPQLMEEELVRIMSEHGVITLGYSGSDPNIQKVFNNAVFNHYPLFWVNRSPPNEEMENILKPKNYTYIQCQGAHQILSEYLRVVDTIKNLEPEVGSGPSIIDLKNAFMNNNPKEPLYLDYLDNKLIELKKGLPDFEKFTEYDDAIVEQIKNGKSISYNFLEAVLLACKYGDKESIDIIYNFFGNFMNLSALPKSDGYSFLIYEFFVLFIAGLIRYNQWDYLGDILTKELFIENNYQEYVPFHYISRYIHALDETRNRRLNSNRVSIMADLIYERFTQTELSKIISHKQFMEADYFLFMRSICQTEDYRTKWAPRSCVYIDKVPSYLNMAQSQTFLEKLSKTVGYEDYNEFIQILESKHTEFDKYFSHGFISSPLDFFDFERLGSRK